MTSYEEVLDRISTIQNGDEGRDRTIRWLTEAHVVGAARDHLGHLEIFMAGAKINPRSRSLREALQHHTWHRENETPLEANRIVFPAFGHFDQIGALICTELLRKGADQNMTTAFKATESLIELTIERLELSQSALLGLAGELLLLDALLRHASEQEVGQLAHSWEGWRRSLRDFTWDGVGIEVKTTSRVTSSHVVQGLHQIEPTPASDDSAGEVRLLLVSLGLQKSEPSANSFTVPQLTQRIINRLESTGNSGSVDHFLSNIAKYGSESGFGYSHATMAKDAPFTTPFTPTFVRGYDMTNHEVDVIRRDDVVTFQHVDTQSLSFRIDLPAALSADNPVSGIHRVAMAILGDS